MAGGARKQIIEKQGSRHQALTLAFLLLTLQPHHDSKAAFEIIGVRVMSIWWSSRESARTFEASLSLFVLPINSSSEYENLCLPGE